MVTHVHELNYWIEKAEQRNWNQVCRHTTKFVAASEAVSLNLQKHHGIVPERIEVVHEFIPIDYRAQPPSPNRELVSRAQLGIPSDAFVVGGSGSETWRKGKDLFVQLAALLRRRTHHDPFGLCGLVGRVTKRTDANSNAIRSRLELLIRFSGRAR